MFAAREILRLTRGHPFDANRSRTEVLGAAAATADRPWTTPGTAHFRFSRGVGSSSWLLRDLVWRSMQAGATYEEAVSEVLRGSIDGWYGGSAGSHRAGLHQRLSRWLDDWKPYRFGAIRLEGFRDGSTLQVSTPHGRSEWLLVRIR